MPQGDSTKGSMFGWMMRILDIPGPLGRQWPAAIEMVFAPITQTPTNPVVPSQKAPGPSKPTPNTF